MNSHSTWFGWGLIILCYSQWHYLCALERWPTLVIFSEKFGPWPLLIKDEHGSQWVRHRRSKKDNPKENNWTQTCPGRIYYQDRFGSKFTTRDKIYQSKKMLKPSKGSTGPQVFINENLTKHNANIFYRAWRLLKDTLISAAWITNGVVYIKISSSLDEKPRRITKLSELSGPTEDTRMKTHDLDSSLLDWVFLGSEIQVEIKESIILCNFVTVDCAVRWFWMILIWWHLIN